MYIFTQELCGESNMTLGKFQAEESPFEFRDFRHHHQLHDSQGASLFNY